MQRLFDPRRLDTQAFAQDAAALSGSLTLRDLPRLREEATGACDDRPIRWSSQGQWRAVAGGPEQAWLQLEAQVSLPLTCQRCLTPVEVDLRISRPFRFVADEATALQEDDESEEDSPVFDPSTARKREKRPNPLTCDVDTWDDSYTRVSHGIDALLRNPTYQQAEIHCEVIVQDDADPAEVKEGIEGALLTYFHPLKGGEDGLGWPFGGTIFFSRVYQHVFTVTGVQSITRLLILLDGEETPACTDIPLQGNALLYSERHEIVTSFNFDE